MDTVAASDFPLTDLRASCDGHSELHDRANSPWEAYTLLCETLTCKVSPSVAALLPRAAGTWNAVRSLDFSRTYVGPKGAVAIAQLCRRLPSLRSLDLSDNYLQNDSVWAVSQLALSHPTLCHVDLSNNPFVSWSGAMSIAVAVAQNPRITFVNLHGTATEADVQETLFLQTRRNAVDLASASDGAVPCPVQHPTAIKLRALQYFFDSCKDPNTGCVGRETLVDGVKELNRMSGRASDAAESSDEYFHVLRARAPSDELNWECFLVLVVLGAAEYSNLLIDALWKVFKEFNVNVSALADDADVRLHGFVEVEAFPAVFVRLLDEKMPTELLRSVEESLDLTGGGHTVNWSEFLYCWYNKGPVRGSRLFGAYVTHFPHSIRPLHY